VQPLVAYVLTHPHFRIIEKILGTGIKLDALGREAMTQRQAAAGKLVVGTRYSIGYAALGAITASSFVHPITVLASITSPV